MAGDEAAQVHNSLTGFRVGQFFSGTGQPARGRGVALVGWLDRSQGYRCKSHCRKLL
jgi:hypothetical protein